MKALRGRGLLVLTATLIVVACGGERVLGPDPFAGTGGDADAGNGGAPSDAGKSTDPTRDAAHGGDTAGKPGKGGMDDAAVTTEPAPLFPDAEVSTYTATIPGHNDPADIYHPSPSDLQTGSYAFPIAVMLQGANVDKKHYSGLFKALAGYGFIVVVGNHAGLFGLLAEQQQVLDGLAFMRAENERADSPVKGVVDVDTLVVLGHSFGGVAGLGAAQGTCSPPFCSTTFMRPPELKAAALFGTNNGAMPMAMMNAPIGVALVQGDKDGAALPADAQATYDKLQAPRALFTIVGANHYGVCDTDNPAGAAAETSAPTLPQADAIQANAKAAAWFLRAVALKDPASIAWLRATTSVDAITLSLDLP